MKKHSTDPSMQLRPSNGGSGPLRWQGQQQNVAMRDEFYKRPPRDTEPERERVGEPTLWEKFLDWRGRLWLEREYRAEARELAADIDYLREITPADVHVPTLEEMRAEHDERAGFIVREARRIREGRDPSTGIDPTTGLDDFDMDAGQRELLRTKWKDGRLTFKELPKVKRTGRRWDEAGRTAVDTWRSTTSQVDPRSVYHFDANEWVLTPTGYKSRVTGTDFGVNGRTFDNKTPEQHSIRLAYLVSPESEEARRQEAEDERVIAALDAAEHFSYTHD